MNHIYKSIFNKALGVFTAVPEFASAHGKGSERTVVGRVAKGTAGFAASALAISVGLALTSTSAVAGPGIYINDGTDTGCLAIPDAQGPNVGIHGISGGVPSPALSLLGPSQVVPDGSYYGLDVMKPCLSSTSANATEERSTQTNRTLFYGKNGPTSVNDNGAKNLTLGGRLDVNSGIIGVGDRGVNGLGSTNSIRMGMGTALSDANKQVDAITIGVNAGASAKHATAIGSATTAKTGYSTALGFQSQAGDPAVTNFNGEYATAIGGKAKALHAYTTALGAETNASGAYATAVGNEAKATHESTTAVGKGAKATNDFATAVGQLALASGKNGTAVGTRNEALGEEATALGYHSHANGSQQLSIGAHAGRNLDGSFSQSTHGISIGSLAGADNATAKSNDDSVLIGTESGRYAQGGNRNTSIGKSAGQYLNGNDNIAMGSNAGSGTATDKLEVSNTTAIGNNSKPLTDDSITIGRDSKAGKVDKFDGKKSIAIGTEATAMGTSSISMGYHAQSDNGHDSITIGTFAKSDNEKAMTIGSYSSASGAQSMVIANNYNSDNSFNSDKSTATARRAMVIGPESHATAEQALTIGDTNTVASARTYAIGNNINAAAGTNDSLAFGTRASVGGASSIALGSNTKTYTDDSISIGSFSESGGPATTGNLLGTKAIAIGYETKALATSAVALGYGATVENGHDSIAIGVKAKTSTQKSTTIGSYSEARGNQSTVIANNYDSKAGKAVSIASGARSQVYGAETTVSGNNSVAIGDTNTVAGARTYAIGNNINVAAGVDDALAFGTKAAVGGANAIALGNTASAAINNAIAVGQASSSTGNSAIAIGTKASAQGDSALAHGVEAQAIAQSSTAIGFRAKAQGYEQISIGSNAGNSSPANAENYGAVFIGRHAGSGNNSATGNTDGVSIGSNAGQNAVSGIKNVAIGPTTGQYVEGSQNLALSTNAGNSVKGDNNLAMMVGAGNNIEGGNNIAIGTNANSGTPTAKRVVTNSIAMGSNTQATSNNTIAIGPQARALAADAVALGLGSLSNHANSVALGAGSATSAAHTGDYTLNTSYTAAGLPNAANGTVSVGSAGKERQIQNVAAGVISATSTDAINGSQLYATNNYLSNLAGGVKNVLGGDAAVDNAGNVTMSNIGDTGEGTVHGAIKNLKDAIDSKVDTTASVTSEDPADIKVDKEAPVGNTTNYKLSLGNDAKAKLAKAATALQTVEGDSNITATKDATDPTKVKLALNKDLTADSLTLGNTAGDHTVVNKDGLTIAGGPSVKKDGINAGDKVISGVADGNIAAGSKEAVNGGQLAEVKSKADSAVQNVVSANPTALTANKVGDTVTLTPNFIAGDLVNADGTVNAPATADEGKLVSAKTVADALKANHFVVDTKGNTETGSEADAKVGSGNKVTFEAGNNLVAKQANTANGGATVKFSLKDDISLNSVTAGTGANQVVLGNDGVKVGGNTYINNDGLNANSKVISNVADGVNPNDAVNKSQLDAVKGVADSAVKSVDTVASEENLVVDNNDPQNPKLRLKKAVNLTSIKLDGATPGNTTYVSGYGLTIEDGPSVKKEGINAGDKKITNVAAGDVSATSKDAVNGAQLHNVASSVANVLGGNAAVDGNGNVTSSDIGGTGANTVDDAIKAVNATAAKHTTVVEGKNVKVTKGKNAAGGDEYTVATKDDLDVTSVTAGNTTVNTNGLTITGGPSVTRGGIDAGNAVITNVRDGKVEANSKDAVNGGQLHATNTKLDGVKAKADTAVQDVKSGDENALTAVKDPSTNIVTVTPKLSGDLVDANGNITAPTTPAEKGKLVTAGTVAQALANTHFVVDTKATDGELDTASQADQKIKAGNKVTLQAGKNLKAKQTNGANGAEVEFSLKDSISLTQVTAGDSTLNTDGLTIAGGPSVKKDGINAGDKTITNVAPGAVTAASKDAVNGGQLYNVANNVKDLIGPDAAIDPATGKVTVADPAKGIGETGKGTIGEAIKSVKDKADTAVQDIKSGDEKALSVTKAGNTYTITPNLSGDLVDANGNITAPTTPADKGKLVTAGTVADALANTHFVVDTKATDGELDAASQADQKVKAGNKVTLQAGKNLKAKQTNGANGAQVEFSLKDSISLTQVTAGEGDNQVVLGNDGVKVGGNTYINKDGLNANSKVISNVADGVNPNDAVNKSQLDAVKGVADSAVKSVDVAANENNLVVDNNDPKNPKLRLRKAVDLDSIKLENNVGEKSFLNSAGLTIEGGPAVTRSGINANNTKVTNVTDGDVNSTSKDAVNGSQLYNVASNVKDLIGPDAAIDPATGKVTVADPTKGIGETGKGTIGEAIKAVKDAADKAAAEHTTVKAGNNIVVTEGTNAAGGKEYTVKTADNLDVTSVKAGDTTVNNDGLTIAGGPSVKKDGINAGDKNITNVADGNVAAGSKDAVNGGQLYDVAKNVADLVGPDATIDPATGKVTVADPTKGIGETGKGTIGDAIKAVNDLAKKAAAEKTSVKAKDGRSNVTVTEGTNAAGGHEYTVDVERSVTNAGSDYVTVTNNHDADSNTTTYTVDVSDKTKASLAKADSAVQGLTSKDGNLNFTKGANGNVEVSFNDNLNVKNVTTDRVQVVNGPSMTKDGINAADKAISNVANGNVAKGSKDAVNGGQLHETAQSVADVIGGGATVKDGKVVAGQNGIGNTGQNTVHGAIAAINQNTANNFNQIRGDLRKMDRDLRGGIAGALATAGLPQAFRPGKSMVAAAASTYRGQSGLAIGVSRISDNGKVILKVTGNTNSRGDFGGTIGAGYQW